MSDLPKKLGQNVFVFNEEENGGESILLVTEYWDNGDGPISGLYSTHRFCLNSYANSAEIVLGSEITPEKLRKLADELDNEMARIKTEAMIKSRK